MFKPQFPSDEDSLKKRRIRRIVFGIIGFLILITLFYIQALKTPSPLGSNVLVFTLVNINIIALVVLVVLIIAARGTHRPARLTLRQGIE